MKECLNFTVAIPTYNGGSRLSEILERLKNQLHTEDISWEIIVVDNNSNDDTANIVKKYQENWQYPFPLRYCFELKQGLAYAREKAVSEAKGELIGFLDDDNYPVSSWVAKAYEFARKYPKAGAIASQIHPNWEIEPPENFQRIAPFLAIVERGNTPLFYNPKSKLLPPGAGLVIRKQAWLESVPNQLILTGRIVGNMLTGEDTEMLSYIQQSNWEIWYNPEMEIYHQIPEWRLQKEYLFPFFKGIGLSRYVTRMVDIKPLLKPAAIFAYMANDLRKILFHIFKHGKKVKTDLVAACEMQLFINSLISPFYLWRNGYFNNKYQG
ncbi:glycosyl transferase [Rivularia sp. PCC 7116]|uniref:hormogonium polysaccharide biosynthesis glycosyltransferase HpsE n=1 Tax=Rivularia sp. PCC 7116 TaxID=373994 RepID=UPI00029ECBB5|nr:hormogonium polysaccharide biosynthesis glycosyltransferase HpsE [Rivularia sp. PCC 7116]AFY54109.1 glycosyl transferase [Rivularia sp. PCC 7116]